MNTKRFVNIQITIISEHVSGTIFSILVFSKYLQWHDALLGIISSTSKILASFFYGFAKTPTVFYIGKWFWEFYYQIVVNFYIKEIVYSNKSKITFGKSDANVSCRGIRLDEMVHGLSLDVTWGVESQKKTVHTRKSITDTEEFCHLA